MEAVEQRARENATGLKFRTLVPATLDDPAASWIRWLTTANGDPIDESHPLAQLCAGVSTALWCDIAYTGNQGWWVQALRDGAAVVVTASKIGASKPPSSHAAPFNRDVMGQVLGSEELEKADALFRGTVESLHQAIYLYQPIWQDGRIVDLEITYCNGAALALPFTEKIVKGARATDVFKNPDLAMLEAEEAWRNGSTAPYSIERSGLIDGIERTIRYEIRTLRVGNHILQTSTDHTIADRLQRVEARQRVILDALTEGVTLMAPVIDDLRVIDLRVLYQNKAADRFTARGLFSGDNGSGERMKLASRTWETNLPAVTFIDTVESTESSGFYTEVEATRIGDLIIQVTRDRTREVRSDREKASVDRRFFGTVESLAESVGIWTPVRDGDGDISEFTLRYANRALSRYAETGGSTSVFPTKSKLVEALRAARARNGYPYEASVVVRNASRIAGEDLVLRASFIAVDDEVVMVASDVTETVAALETLRSSSSLLRSAMDALQGAVHH